MAGLWLILTAAAWGFAMIGRTAADLERTAWRHWRVIALALIGSTWATIILLYLTDPMTARRWAIYWPLLYGQP